MGINHIHMDADLEVVVRIVFLVRRVALWHGQQCQARRHALYVWVAYW